MGAGYSIRCSNCNCDYEKNLFAGVGMMFPKTYAEVMKKARSGRISKEHTRFMKEHPDGAINAEIEIYQCEECGDLFTDYNLSMYIPRERVEKPSKKGIWSVSFPAEEAEYEVPWDLEENYELVKYYQHKCPKCKGKANVVNNIDHVNKKCPKCGSNLIVDFLLWD